MRVANACIGNGTKISYGWRSNCSRGAFKMRQYIISLDIDPIYLDAAYATLPLHCTIMPRFETLMTAAEIVRRVEYPFKRSGFIPVESDRLDHFGVDKDVLAHRIKPEESVRNLHKQILSILKRAGARFPESSQWLGDNFTPHVSHASDREFSSGRAHVFRTATVFERYTVDGKKILRPQASIRL